MTRRISDSILERADTNGDGAALRFDGRTRNYADLAGDVESCASGLLESGLAVGGRVGIYLEKRFETVAGLFGAAAAGGAFVPLNPLLKPRQVRYILADCNVRILLTSSMRLAGLAEALAECPDLETVVLVDGAGAGEGAAPDLGEVEILSWDALLRAGAASGRQPHAVSDSDLAAILYTSGSTGPPKGVMLSHRNLTVGAESVASYLGNHPADRILSVLPLSFDAGLSQLTTAFHAGATAVLLNYLLPRDVVRACAAEGVTGLTCVPPLWIQLAQLDWPAEAAASLRYFANTGGHMPRATLDKLRAALPAAAPYLMYGLTEAFRSTYLDPAEIDRRPDSMGKAIPNAEILVVNESGQMCGPGETGELVHCGPLVAMGYWNDAERTAERFRPAPKRPRDGQAGDEGGEIAVWSGDSVRGDEDGFLYFVARRDEMIKTSGYRVSPTEIEEVVYASNAVGQAVALGAADASLGQAIVVVATPPAGGVLDPQMILDSCRRELPAYMVPRRIIERDSLPYNANGKIDRKSLAAELSALFEEAAT